MKRKKKRIGVVVVTYIENLKRLSNTDSDESFSTESLNGERDAGGNTSYSSVRFKNTHSAFSDTDDRRRRKTRVYLGF
jgi:hypothetical protein